MSIKVWMDNRRSLSGSELVRTCAWPCSVAAKGAMTKLIVKVDLLTDGLVISRMKENSQIAWPFDSRACI
jgi:hypothetical protein